MHTYPKLRRQLPICAQKLRVIAQKLRLDIIFLDILKSNMHISSYPDLQKWQDQLHLDRNVKTLWITPTFIIDEPALSYFHNYCTNPAIVKSFGI